MEFNITVELDEKLNEKSGERVLVALEQFHPAAGRSVLGRLEAIFTLSALNINQALVLAQQLAGSLGGKVVGLHIVTTADFDRTVEATPVPELVTASGAADILGISKAAVGQKFTAGELPGQRVGDRTIVFSRHDIEKVAAARQGHQ